MTDIRVQSLEQPIDVSEYLFRRLYEVGVRSVHGVPGDYNLVALDYLHKSGLQWVGSVNELNAAYAADGYARVNKIGALVTTFGVGELSAINGVAGAFSEHIPVVHIVGYPSTVSQRNGMLLHHTLGNGDFNVFANMSAQISCDMAKLNNPAEIADQIDHALRQCWVHSRPVYITLPTDMAQAKVEGARLSKAIDLSEPSNDAEKEDYVVDVILKYLNSAKNPMLLVDACAIRHRVLSEIHDLIDKTGLPVFVTPMGKSAINESHTNFGGVYAGDGSHPLEVKDIVEASDLIITIGALKSDFNTAGFSYRTSQLKSIDLHSDHCIVRYSTYPGIRMKGVLQKLVQKVDPRQLSIQKTPAVRNEVKANQDESPTITQAWFWPKVGEFFRENDIVVTETGTANFGIWDTKFPTGVTALSQVLWGSIGWSVGACQGAALAARDSGRSRRTILFVGDGSFQLTAQEVSTMIRHKLNPIMLDFPFPFIPPVVSMVSFLDPVLFPSDWMCFFFLIEMLSYGRSFVICNEGFTIERFIHGMDASYNDIVAWDNKGLVDVFGGKGVAQKYTVKTKDELCSLFADHDFSAAREMQFVELHMPKKDAPRALMMTAQASAKTNARAE